MKNNVFEKRRRAWQTIGDDLIKTKEINKELLGALEMIVTSDIGWDSGEWESQCDDGRTPAEVAKAAIAKARGEQ